MEAREVKSQEELHQFLVNREGASLLKKHQLTKGKQTGDERCHIHDTTARKPILGWVQRESGTLFVMHNFDEHDGRTQSLKRFADELAQKIGIATYHSYRD
ncbi:MAG: hypothetical protein V1722_02170 [Candidatus Micrarchaeota archaeon]